MQSLKPVAKREKAPHKAKDDKALDEKKAEHQRTAKYRDDLLSGATIEITGIDTTQPLAIKGLQTADPYVTVWLPSFPGTAVATDVCGGTLKPAFDLRSKPLVLPLTHEALAQLRVGKLLFCAEVLSLGRIVSDTFLGYTNGHLGYADAKSGEIATDELRVLDATDAFVGCIRLGVKCNVSDVKEPGGAGANLPPKPAAAPEKFKAKVSRSLMPAFARAKAPHKVKDEKLWEAKAQEQHTSALVKEDQMSGASVSVVGIDCFGKLLAMDGDTSDPYVNFFLANGYGALSTTAKPNTLTPAWNLKAKPLRFPLTNGELALLRAGRLAFNAEIFDLDVSFDDFMGYTNLYLRWTEQKNGLIETDLQLFSADKPAGEMRLYLTVDVESAAPAGLDLPSRFAPDVTLDAQGNIVAGAAGAGRRSVAQEASTKSKPPHDCRVVVYAAPAFSRREKAHDVVKDEKAWAGPRRDAHNKLAAKSAESRDHALHDAAAVSVIDIRTTVGFGKAADVYVVACLPAFTGGALKTTTQKKTTEPVWDLQPKPLTFPLTNKAVRELNAGRAGELNGCPFALEVWALGLFADDLIGWTNVSLKAADFAANNLCTYDLPLLPANAKAGKNQPTGVLRVTFRLDAVPRDAAAAAAQAHTPVAAAAAPAAAAPAAAAPAMAVVDLPAAAPAENAPAAAAAETAPAAAAEAAPAAAPAAAEGAPAEATPAAAAADPALSA